MPDRHGRGVDDPLPHRVDSVAGRKVHHRVGPVADRQQQLLQLALGVAGQGRLADVGVDLRPRGHADADRPQALGQVDRLAGMTIRPSATSRRTNSASSCSERATASISGVTAPARACSICVMLKMADGGQARPLNG